MLPSLRFVDARLARRGVRLGAGALALLTLGACAKGGGRGGFAMPPVPVEVSDVQPQMMREQFRALGGIEADESVLIVSEVNAVAARLPFTEGAAIGKGALIAQLDDREAAADAQRAEAQHALAKSNAERAEKLFAGQLIARSQLDDAHTNLKVAEAEEEAMHARLAKTRIRAPFSGVVGRRRVSPGAYLKSGDVITELARLEVMKVRFSAPERELEHLGRGHRVEVTTPAIPGQSFPGEIRVVDPMIDPETRTVQIVAQVSNRQRLLRPGMSGNVAVTLAEHPGALVVPDEAVFAEGSQSFVFVVNPDSSVTRTAVTLGIRDSARVEIVNGLVAGARVVRTGHQKLFPGAKVVPISDQATAMAGDAPPPATPAKPAAKPAGPAPAGSKAGRTATRAGGGR